LKPKPSPGTSLSQQAVQLTSTRRLRPPSPTRKGRKHDLDRVRLPFPRYRMQRDMAARPPGRVHRVSVGHRRENRPPSPRPWAAGSPRGGRSRIVVAQERPGPSVPRNPAGPREQFRHASSPAYRSGRLFPSTHFPLTRISRMSSGLPRSLSWMREMSAKVVIRPISPGF
jgi:hypothetical protein